MNNIKKHSKGIKWMLAISAILIINLLISVLAATGLVYAFNPGVHDNFGDGDQDVWGYEHIRNGDVIETSQGAFVVIDKEARGTVSENGFNKATDEIGILVRYVGDSTGMTAQFSKDDIKVEDDDGLETKNGYINNLVTLVVVSDEQGTQNQANGNNRRNFLGTNLWEEATIRDTLNDFYDGFDDAEKSLTMSMPQQQLLWWGDGEANIYGSTDNAVSYDSNSQNQAKIPFVGQYKNALGTSIAKWSEHTSFADINDTVVQGRADILDENDSSALRYTIDDKVFLPTLQQATLFATTSPGYYKQTFTRTPVVDGDMGGSQVYAITENGSKPMDAKETFSISPMLYFSKDILFGHATQIQDKRTFSDIIKKDGDYSVADLYVGDYITMGGTEYRVLGKDNNGVMIRADKAVDVRAFDEVRPFDAEHMDVNRAPWNSTFSLYNGSSTADPDLTRQNLGSNFYLESSVREYLLDDYYTRLSSTETSAIKTVTQGVNFWTGEHFRIFTVANESQALVQTNPLVIIMAGINSGGNVQHVDRLANFDLQSGTIKQPLDIKTGWTSKSARNVVGFDLKDKLALDEHAGENLQMNEVTNDNTDLNWKDVIYTSLKEANYDNSGNIMKLPEILFEDPIFIQSYAQVMAMQKGPLRNAAGGKYAQVLKDNWQGEDGLISETGVQRVMTRTPVMYHGTNATTQSGAGVVDYAPTVGTYSGTNGGSYTGEQGGWTGDNIFIGGNWANNESGVLPTMYLRHDTRFVTDGAVEFNPGETATTLFGSEGVRRTAIDGNRTQLASFKIQSNGLDISGGNAVDEVKKALQGTKVGISVANIEFATAITNVEGIKGLEAKDGTIVGIPEVAGKQTLKLTDDAGHTLEVEIEVAKGDASIKTNPAFDSSGLVAGDIGDDLSKHNDKLTKTPEFNEVGGLTPNKAHFEFVEDQQIVPGQQTVSVKLVIEDDNWNEYLNRFTVTFTIDTEGGLGLGDATPINVVYGVTWEKILADNPSMGVDVSHPDDEIVKISLLDTDITEVPTVGEHKVEVQFTGKSTVQIVEATVIVAQKESTFPNINDADGNPAVLTAIFGDKVSDLRGQLANINSSLSDGQIAIADEDKDKTVGDVTSTGNTINVVFTPNSDQYTTAKGTIKVIVSKAVRDIKGQEAISTRLSTFLDRSSQVVTKAKLGDIDLPQGLAWKNPDEAIVATKGEKLTKEIVVGGKVSNDSETNYSVDNYEEVTISVTFTVGGEDAAPEGPNMVLIIVLVVVGLAAVGGVVFFVLKKKQSSGSKF
ncbi:MAG: hypothetical protein FWF56_03140 [Firmicutes bacterium]|nr:hypothetical protein [Bacillota bacterium]